MTESCCTMQRNGTYDLAILGGGSAAFAAALRGSELGGGVLLVNQGTIGGTCVNVGCVPSRPSSARPRTRTGTASRASAGSSRKRGASTSRSSCARRTNFVASLRQARYVDVVAGDPRIEVLEGRARLRDAHTLEADGETHRAGKLVIATGARPALPPIPGLDAAHVWDSTVALDTKELPRELMVLGGRYVALELGQMFARLGSRVTIVQRSDQLLPGEDSDIAHSLRALLEKEGIHVRVGQQVER
jgi:mercuric reductase